MIGKLYLAWRHVRFNAGRSLVLVLALSVLATTPLATGRLAEIAREQLNARAAATPLIYGPAGSKLDLSMSALFFEGRPTADLSLADYDRLAEAGLAVPAPILRTHSARRFPIVATDLEYFDFRDLKLADGRRMARLGEAVIGAAVARDLNLGVGDTIQSDSEDIFELAGAYPLRMEIVGVLAPANSPDDRAVLTDLRTGWVVAGLGHGHQDLSTADQSVLFSNRGGVTVANAKLKEYVEITDANRDGFHFHGPPESFPISAILLDPYDARSAAILQGRVADEAEEGGAARQIFRPLDVVGQLLEQIFRVKTLLDMLTAAVGFAALLALALLIWLTVKLRRREFEIALRLGADRGLLAQLVTAELAILAAGALCLSAAVLGALDLYGAEVVERILFGM